MLSIDWSIDSSIDSRRGTLDQDHWLIPIPVYCIKPNLETAKSSFRVVAAKKSRNLPSQCNKQSNEKSFL